MFTDTEAIIITSRRFFVRNAAMQKDLVAAFDGKTLSLVKCKTLTLLIW